MSDTEKNEPDDELDLAPETVEDLDTAGDDVKGGETKIRYAFQPERCN